jgi:hypothetical protein
MMLGFMNLLKFRVLIQNEDMFMDFSKRFTGNQA